MARHPTEMSHDEVFGMYQKAAEGSTNAHIYGAEVERRKFQLAQRAAESAASSAIAARWAAIFGAVSAVAAIGAFIATLLKP